MFILKMYIKIMCNIVVMFLIFFGTLYLFKPESVVYKATGKINWKILVFYSFIGSIFLELLFLLFTTKMDRKDLKKMDFKFNDLTNERFTF